jgi:NADH:ubiquinone oxidoreductase subunit
MFNNFMNSKQRYKIKFSSKTIPDKVMYFNLRVTFIFWNLDTGTRLKYRKCEYHEMPNRIQFIRTQKKWGWSRRTQLRVNKKEISAVKQNWLGHVRRNKDTRHRNEVLNTDHWNTKTLITMKDTTRRMYSWGQHRPLFGLTSRPEREE